MVIVIFININIPVAFNAFGIDNINIKLNIVDLVILGVIQHSSKIIISTLDIYIKI